jgi:hypothetical protein
MTQIYEKSQPLKAGFKTELEKSVAIYLKKYSFMLFVNNP